MGIELEHIVKAAGRQEMWAQSLLYERFAPKMYAVCRRYTRSRDEANDLLQEAFIKVFETIKQLQNVQVVEAWIRQIVVNCCINYVTRHRKLVYVDIKQFELQHEELLIEDFNDPFDTDDYDVEDVFAAVQKLSPACRLVFNMHEVDEMPYAEIASLLGQNEASVRATLARAKQTLRQHLAANAADE